MSIHISPRFPLFLALLLATSPLFARTPQNNTQKPTPRSASSTSPTASDAHAGAVNQLLAELDAMQRKVNLLLSEALSVQDANTRNALNTDADLWQQLVSALQLHLARVQQHHGSMSQKNNGSSSENPPH
jgi:hypothetical protein